jgi:PAS domain S-box-containing protein
MLALRTFCGSTVLLAGSEIGDGFALRAAQPGATVALAGRYESLLRASARVAGPTEINYVAQEFNRMLDALERQREERAALVGHIDKLFRLARDVILLIDPSGNMVEANDAAVAAYGYSLDELRGMNIRDLRTVEAQAAIDRDWQGASGPLGLLFETVNRRKDGSTFPVEVSAQTIDIEGKPYRQSFIRDITERKRAGRRTGRCSTRTARSAISSSGASAPTAPSGISRSAAIGCSMSPARSGATAVSAPTSPCASGRRKRCNKNTPGSWNPSENSSTRMSRLPKRIAWSLSDAWPPVSPMKSRIR